MKTIKILKRTSVGIHGYNALNYCASYVKQKIVINFSLHSLNNYIHFKTECFKLKFVSLRFELYII